MASSDTVALVAVIDQWNAYLNELVASATSHITHCPHPELNCPGAHVEAEVEELDLAELRTLAELAIFRLAKAGDPHA